MVQVQLMLGCLINHSFFVELLNVVQQKAIAIASSLVAFRFRSSSCRLGDSCHDFHTPSTHVWYCSAVDVFYFVSSGLPAWSTAHFSKASMLSATESKANMA